MTGSRDREVEFYADDAGREPCRAWMEKLPPTKRIALEVAIQFVLARRGLAVMETEFGKALGGGLYEFRLRWSADEVRRKVWDVSSGAVGRPEKILLRAFFCTSGARSSCCSAAMTRPRSPDIGVRSARSHRRASCRPPTRRPSGAACANLGLAGRQFD